MKKNTFFLLFVALFTINQLYAQQLQPIPDPVLRNFLIAEFPECFSGDLMDTSCYIVKYRDELNVSNMGISDLSGIQFFTHLTTLKCSKNNLTTLEDVLPDSLRFLDCEYNKLTLLPALPHGLNVLLCSGNQLTALPALPSQIDIIHCSNNQLTQLPAFPNSFSTLAADSNKIAVLPAIPDSLYYISITNNALTEFPAVSVAANKIFYINVSDNTITAVPAVPPSLQFLQIADNLISELPALPSGLLSLGCSNNQIRCLPYLPMGLKWLSFRENPITCMPNMPSDLIYFSPSTTTICTAENTTQNNCTYYTPARGIVFVDYNGNNIQDPGDTEIQDILISATKPDAPQTLTDAMGRFTLYLAPGTYVYRANVSDTLFTLSALRLIKIVDGVSNAASYDFGLVPTKEIKTLAVTITASPQPRPGFPTGYTITCINTGNFPVTNAELRFSYAPEFSYESASLPYTSHQDTVITWNIPVLNPGEKKNISVAFTLPAFVALGTPLPSSAVLKPINAGDTTRNYCFLHNEARGSYDPNDKNVLPEGTVTPVFISNQENLEYTIRFQNTGNADAINVVVMDTISSKLDIETLTMLSASHPYRYEQRGNKAIWTFENIHLPDMQTNEPESHGYIKFTIKPVTDLALGDAITNRAGILFDFNEPIITNTTQTIVAEPPVVTGITSKASPAMKLTVYPNPCTDKVNITFNEHSYSGNATVRIWNNLNQQVINQSVVLNKGMNTLEADVHRLPAGMYYIEISYNGASHTSKLLK